MKHKGPQVDKETAGKIEDFRKSVDADAENVIFRIFPSKGHTILRLSLFACGRIHRRDGSPASQCVHSTAEPDKKKRKRENGEPDDHALNDTQHARFPNLFHANKHLLLVNETLKKECEQLIELTDKVKLWINLTMPKIEDGDNFGTLIRISLCQPPLTVYLPKVYKFKKVETFNFPSPSIILTTSPEVLNELHRSQESGYNMRDSVRQNHLNRAKICSKIIKYPHLEDYALALKEHDDKQLYVARQNLSDLRNVYAIVTDILHKNISKLRTPKGNNGVGLY
ncbi:proteasome activator pa28 beta subunit-domain-containing protein [Russula aff. rugulosa BPL654]|nr:proteasome activator pa28 beta subunit-domain-containing protein [Russula aff. rugulosa BPL654]